MISDSNKNRLKNLAGILCENIHLVPEASGRSEKGTLSWYVEEYLINISMITINNLDKTIIDKGGKLSINQPDTKMQENSFSTKLIAEIAGKKIIFILSFLVNFSENSNTSASVYHDGLTEKFNLNSKHSLSDINLLTGEITNYISNLISTK